VVVVQGLQEVLVEEGREEGRGAGREEGGGEGRGVVECQEG
jgi:hypothetical protein